MEETDWDSYGTGNYEKCADCMVHCGYEPTAVADTVAHPLKALRVALRGVETEKPMVQDIPLDKQRPAEFVFEKLTAELGESEKRAEHAQRRGLAPQAPRGSAAAIYSPQANPPGASEPTRRPAGRGHGRYRRSAIPPSRTGFADHGDRPRPARRETGRPRSAATSATAWLSMSIATAPVLRFKTALSAAVVRASGDPARVPARVSISSANVVSRDWRQAPAQAHRSDPSKTTRSGNDHGAGPDRRIEPASDADTDQPATAVVGHAARPETPPGRGRRLHRPMSMSGFPRQDDRQRISLASPVMIPRRWVT